MNPTRYFAFYRPGTDIIESAGEWTLPLEADPPQVNDLTPAEISKELHDQVRAMPNTQRARWDGSTVVIENKPDLPAVIDKTTITANNTDTATISGLPNPSIVNVIRQLAGGEWESYEVVEVTDGTFEFSVSEAGNYMLRAMKRFYNPKEFTINAV